MLKALPYRRCSLLWLQGLPCRSQLIVPLSSCCISLKLTSLIYYHNCTTQKLPHDSNGQLGFLQAAMVGGAHVIA